jgi:hypothetical protein
MEDRELEMRKPRPSSAISPGWPGPGTAARRFGGWAEPAAPRHTGVSRPPGMAGTRGTGRAPPPRG